MKKTPRKNSANDLYDGCYQNIEKLRYYQDTVQITEGIHDLLHYEECYWLLDFIIEQTIESPLIQIWEVIRTDNQNLKIVCSDENGKAVENFLQQDSIFYFDYLKIIKKGQLFCLPSEFDMY